MRSSAIGTKEENGGLISSHFQNSSIVWLSSIKLGMLAENSLLEDLRVHFISGTVQFL